ncbi:MAG: hypothetical protein ACKN9U_13060 [Pirellulaceae bacterium]
MADSFVVNFRDRSKRSAKLPHQANATLTASDQAAIDRTGIPGRPYDQQSTGIKPTGQVAMNRQPHPQAKGLFSAGRIIVSPAGRSKQQQKTIAPKPAGATRVPRRLPASVSTSGTQAAT